MPSSIEGDRIRYQIEKRRAIDHEKARLEAKRKFLKDFYAPKPSRRFLMLREQESLSEPKLDCQIAAE